MGWNPRNCGGGNRCDCGNNYRDGRKTLGIRNFVHHFYSLPLLNNLFENNTLPEKSSVFFNEYDLASLNDQLDWS